MIGLLIIGDTHVRAKNPEKRVDDFRAAMMRKLREILQIRAERKPDGVIHLGDLYDAVHPSYDLQDEVLDLLAPGGPLDILGGNHDMHGHNPNTVRYTAFGHALRRCPEWLQSIGHVTGIGGRTYADPFDRSVVRVNGFDFDHDFEESIKRDDSPLIQEWPDDCWRVQVLHAQIQPGAFFGSNASLDEVRTNAHLVISGHYHPGFPWTRRDDGVVFYNPGSVCRLAALESSIERTPQVAMIKFSGRPSNVEFGISLEEIPLRSAAPGCEVFGVDAIRERKDEERSIEQFVDAVRQAEFEGAGGERFLQEASKTIEGVTPRHVQEALRRLQLIKMED